MSISSFATAFALASIGASHAETGNSMVYMDQENNRVIALDRVHLATLPAGEREAVLGDLSEELGEGRIAETPGSFGDFVLGRQQDSSGSLTGKSLDIEFATLGEEPELSQADAPGHEREAMRKIDQPEGIYYVAAPGVWGKEYGGEAWNAPSNASYKSTLTACKGAKPYEYNKTNNNRAFWDWVGRKTNYNVAVGYEKDLKKVSINGAEFKVTAKGTYTSGTQKQTWWLWSDSWFDFDDGWLPDGNKLYQYDEKTAKLSTFVGLQTKLSYPLAAIKASDTTAKVTLASGGLYAIATLNVGNTLSSEDGVRHKYVNTFGYAEQSATATRQAEVGIEAKVKVANTEASATVTLGYRFSYGIATGTRDFDYYCFDADPQHYSHKGYMQHEVYFKKQAQVKILGRTISLSQNRTLFTKTAPGRFTSTDSPELRNTSIDALM